jgi:hypothetical protein
VSRLNYTAPVGVDRGATKSQGKFAMKCHLCGSKVTYQGFTSVACDNTECVNYDGVSAALIRAVWIQTQGATNTSLYWCGEDLNIRTLEVSGDLVTYAGDWASVRKAKPGEAVIGVCVQCKKYRTREEAMEDFLRTFQATSW